MSRQLKSIFLQNGSELGFGGGYKLFWVVLVVVLVELKIMAPKPIYRSI